MSSEIYVDDDRYDFEVEQLIGVLNRFHMKRIETYPAPVDHAELYNTVDSSLRIGGMIDLGDMKLVNGRVEPEHHADLVRTIADLEPEMGSGRFEAWQVRYALAMHGIYSERHRPTDDDTAHEAAQKFQEVGKLLTRPVMESLATMGAGDVGKLRQLSRTMRGDHQREIDAAAELLPDNLKTYEAA